MLSVLDFNELLVAREIDAGDPAGADVGLEALGLVFQVDHHGRSVDALRVSGEIVDVGRLGELSAGLHALIKDGLHVRAGGVDGGGISCGARSDDQAFDVFLGFHGTANLLSWSRVGAAHLFIQLQHLVPQAVLRGRGDDADDLTPNRVHELDAAGMEVDGGVVVGAPSAILDVALDRDSPGPIGSPEVWW